MCAIHLLSSRCPPGHLRRLTAASLAVRLAWVRPGDPRASCLLMAAGVPTINHVECCYNMAATYTEHPSQINTLRMDPAGPVCWPINNFTAPGRPYQTTVPVLSVVSTPSSPRLSPKTAQQPRQVQLDIGPVTLTSIASGTEKMMMRPFAVFSYQTLSIYTHESIWTSLKQISLQETLDIVCCSEIDVERTWTYQHRQNS